ncbi:endolytic transglycosylase MltG [Kitasatospora sp. NRRL B-11411]|uniref:endolytic transglycosylase MltG n=1 Tax=Kitasatospora sp. NRRL B-11411 TaxID=1463822 RepID=UPI00068CB86A|nr:endolytic transglycosylase MltG [Kitasatospora sp. NRRL B-11411]
MTDQSGRYGSQGDQPWYPGEQPQPQGPYGQQDYPQQYPQGYPQQQGGVPQDGSYGGQQQFVQQQPGMQQPGMQQGGIPQGYPQQGVPQGGSYGGQQQFVQQQGYPQQQGGVPQGGSYGGQQQFVRQQPGMQQQGYPQGQPVPQQMPMGQGHQGHPQQQGGSYGGQQQFVPQQSGARQGMPGQQGMTQQGMVQQGMVQQGTPPHGFPVGQLQGQQLQQPGMPQPGMQQRPVPGRPGPGGPQQQRPAAAGGPEPAGGPGPDGIDWEAEAAALDAPPAGRRGAAAAVDERADQEHEDWAEDEYPDEEAAEDDSFFSEQDNSREAERKRKEKGKKSGRRNSGACLVVALVLLGGLGGAGWWGYGFYQQHFGPPPDFKGDGTGSVNITVKDGAGGDAIGKTLVDAGVVKSIKAFHNEYEKDTRGRGIQPGIYTMKHQMSAAAAFKELVDSNGGNALIIPEGLKAADIYTKIDAKLKLQAGTTANVAKEQAGSLGLPAYANNNPEGFLWPTRYSVADGMKPEDLLKQMVANAVQKYGDLKLDEAAQKLGLKNAYEVVTEASILQAEGNNSEDFGKMARAMSNRLTTNVTQHKLGVDTTLQYSLGRTKLTEQEINDGSNKYNSYINPGLPPTPIGNPGEEALDAVLNPTPGDWVFWLAVSPQETKFAATGAEHAKNTEAWCLGKGMKYDAKHVACTS